LHIVTWCVQQSQAAPIVIKARQPPVPAVPVQRTARTALGHSRTESAAVHAERLRHPADWRLLAENCASRSVTPPRPGATAPSPTLRLIWLSSEHLESTGWFVSII